MIHIEADRSIKDILDNYGAYTKKEHRLFERLNYADYIMEGLKVKHLKKRVHYIIKKQENLEDLCRSCTWETIITAIVFYTKCHYNSKVYPNYIDRYKTCTDNNLTLKTYSVIISRLKLLS